MATGKRFYWIKLKDSFMTSDTVDYLMSQPEGANYVVLYQMLCLKTINTDGRLSRQIGDVIIPYDVEKIQRDCKWFSTDTIRVALNLYKAFGLIYEDIDGTLVMADHSNLVGSETDYAEQKKLQRQNKALLLEGVDNVHSNVQDNVHTEIRDKENRDKEIRDKEIEILPSNEGNCRTDVQRVVNAWNEAGLKRIVKLDPNSTRAKSLVARIRDYGVDTVIETIKTIPESDFLMGRVRDFEITFDWFVKPNNFPKVLEGNYKNKSQEDRLDAILAKL